MASDGAESETSDEWQHLSPTSSPSAPPSLGWNDSLLVHDNYLGKESAFHPSHHEELAVVPIPQPQPPLLSSSSSLDDEQQQQEEEEEGEVVVPLDDEAKDDGLGAVTPSSSGSLLGAVYRVVCNGSFIGRGAAGIAAVVAVSWAFAKFRKLEWSRWKRIRGSQESAVAEKLIILMKQKEERISQLMLQIARMNEVMLAQRRVRVLRVA